MNNLKKFSLFKESKNIKQDIDFYYLEKDISTTEIRNIKNIIENNNYRSICTFSTNIEHFQDFECLKVALVNYPPKRYNHRSLIKSIKSVLNLNIDEIEFPFDKKFMKWDKSVWRNIVLLCSSKGIKLRALIDFVNYNDNESNDIINYLKEIGILSIMTSTGLIPEKLNMNQLKDLIKTFPKLVSVKVTGINEQIDIENFKKLNIDLFATTKDLLKIDKNKDVNVNKKIL